ncbi:MAG: hypothetical protein ACXWTY_12280, partial [Methylobacter sp.]
KGYLPAVADILADPDLDGVKRQDWFVDFMESLNKKPEAVAEINDPTGADTASDEKMEAIADDAVSHEKTEDGADEAERNPFAAAAVAPINEEADVDDGHVEDDETEVAVEEASAVTEPETVVENKTEVDEEIPVTEKN